MGALQHGVAQDARPDAEVTVDFTSQSACDVQTVAPVRATGGLALAEHPVLGALCVRQTLPAVLDVDDELRTRRGDRRPDDLFPVLCRRLGRVGEYLVQDRPEPGGETATGALSGAWICSATSG